MPEIAQAHGRMLAAERRQRIVDMLQDSSSVLISDICQVCHVSAVTARADLAYLETEGQLRRTRGGAVPLTDYAMPRVSDNVRKNARAKQLIGRRAAELVSDGETILVGSGSTTLELVKALHGKQDVTVITNDCKLLSIVAARFPDLTLVSTGGVLGRDFGHYYGPLLSASLADVYLDKVFLGADGFEPGFGFLAEHERTSSTKREFMRHARRRVVLMDASKVGRGISFMRFARPDEVDVVVMDRDPDGVVFDACNQGERPVEVLEAAE